MSLDNLGLGGFLLKFLFGFWSRYTMYQDMARKSIKLKLSDKH